MFSQHNETLDIHRNNSFDFLFYEGIRCFISEEYDSAEQYYIKCMELNPCSSATYYWLSMVYSYKRMDRKSLYYAKKSVDFDFSNNKWFKLRLSEAYSALSKFDSSAMILRDMIIDYPVNEDLYIQAADKFSKSGFYKEALEIIEKYEKTFGYKDFVAISKIDLYMKLFDNKNTNEEVRRFLNSKKEDSENAFKSIIRLYSENGRNDVALKLLKKRIKKNNSFDYIWANMFFSKYYIENHNMRLAEKYLAKYFSDNNLDPINTVDFLYSVFLKNSNYYNKSETEHYINYLLNKFPDNTYVNLFQVYWFKHLGEKEKIFDVLRKTLDKDKNNFFIWSELINYYLENKMFEKVYSLSCECVKYFPKEFYPYYTLSVSLITMRRYREALPYLEKALERTLDINQRIVCYNFLADCYYSLGDIEKNLSICDKIIELQPDNDIVLNNYAYQLSLKGERLEDAESMSFKAINLVPANDFYLATYAWILFQRKKYEVALKAIRKVFGIKKEQPSIILDHYGDILYANGCVDEAIEKWKLAFKNADNFLKEKLKFKIEHGLLVD